MGRNEDKKNMKICSHCGEKVAAGSTTCPHCGIALKVPPKIPLEKIKYAKPKEKSIKGDGKKSSTTEEEPKWKEGKNWAKKSLKSINHASDKSKLEGITCPKCGKLSPIDAVVCAYCGEKFDQSYGVVKTTLFAFPANMGPYLSKKALKENNLVFSPQSSFVDKVVPLSDIGGKLIAIFDKHYPQYKIINAEYNWGNPLSLPVSFKLVSSELEIWFELRTYRALSTPSNPGFFVDLHVIGTWDGVIHFVYLFDNSLNYLPWEHARWDKFQKRTNISMGEVLDGWREIINKKFELVGKSEDSELENFILKREETRKKLEERDSDTDLRVFEQLKKDGLISNHLTKPQDTYERALKAIDPDESIKAIFGVRKPQIGTGILTNKRILLESYSGKAITEVIDFSNIHFFDTMLDYLFINNKKYRFFNMPELGKIFTETIKKYKAEMSKNMTAKEKENIALHVIPNLIHVDGIPFLSGKKVILKLHPNKLGIINIDGNKSYKIKLKNINDIKIKTEKEITEQERHTLMRALAGGILFGGTGAIVGAISGVPNKQITVTHKILLIDYTSKEEEEQSLMFIVDPKLKQTIEGVNFIPNLVKFREEVIKLIGKNDSENGEEVEL